MPDTQAFLRKVTILCYSHKWKGDTGYWHSGWSFWELSQTSEYFISLVLYSEISTIRRKLEVKSKVTAENNSESNLESYNIFWWRDWVASTIVDVSVELQWFTDSKGLFCASKRGQFLKHQGRYLILRKQAKLLTCRSCFAFILKWGTHLLFSYMVAIWCLLLSSSRKLSGCWLNFCYNYLSLAFSVLTVYYIEHCSMMNFSITSFFSTLTNSILDSLRT